jgi:hypothetical protein
LPTTAEKLGTEPSHLVRIGSSACLYRCNEKVSHILDGKVAYLFFDCRGQATGLPPSRQGVTGGRTTARFTDPYMGLKAALFGRSTVDPILGKSCKCESFKWHLYSYKCLLMTMRWISLVPS